MHRSNPLQFALGFLFFGALVVIWLTGEGFGIQANFFLWFFYFCAASAIGFWMWRHALRRSRLIDEIPTSKIVSAPQGYVELTGVAAVANAGLVSGIANVPCVWYRYEIAKRRNDGRNLVLNLIYVPVKSHASLAEFIIDDGSGRAAIFPYRAEIICEHRQVWYEEDTRYTEERILPGDFIYVLGEFSTHNPAENNFNVTEATLSQISVWQEDKKNLLIRFDKDGNGTLDADEWEAMHNAAREHALAQQQALGQGAQRNLISYPTGSRHFLISSRKPAKLVGHYRWWRNIGLGLFFAAGAAAVWLAGILAVT